MIIFKSSVLSLNVCKPNRVTDQNVSPWSHEFLINKYQVWFLWHLEAERVRTQTIWNYSDHYGKSIHATISEYGVHLLMSRIFCFFFLHSLGGRFRIKFPNVQSPHHQIIGRLCDWQITQPITCSRSPGTDSTPCK